MEESYEGLGNAVSLSLSAARAIDREKAFRGGRQLAVQPWRQNH
jgi:hypothetical protein